MQISFCSETEDEDEAEAAFNAKVEKRGSIFFRFVSLFFAQFLASILAHFEIKLKPNVSGDEAKAARINDDN